MSETTELNWQAPATGSTDWKSIMHHLFTDGNSQAREVIEVHDESGRHVVRMEPGLVSYSIGLSEEQYLWLQKNINNNPEG